VPVIAPLFSPRSAARGIGGHPKQSWPMSAHLALIRLGSIQDRRPVLGLNLTPADELPPTRKRRIAGITEVDFVQQAPQDGPVAP